MHGQCPVPPLCKASDVLLTYFHESNFRKECNDGAEHLWTLQVSSTSSHGLRIWPIWVFSLIWQPLEEDLCTGESVLWHFEDFEGRVWVFFFIQLKYWPFKFGATFNKRSWSIKHSSTEMFSMHFTSLSPDYQNKCPSSLLPMTYWLIKRSNHERL